MSFPFTIVKESAPGMWLLSLRGRIDGLSAPKLETCLQNCIRTSGKIVALDFSEVDYISSLGLRVLLVAAKQAREKSQKIPLCNLQKGVAQVFEITGFTPLFDVYASRDALLRSRHVDPALLEQQENA